ncbi:hypothetical protein CEXT_555291 [Caerostris extrusa]|uniref:Uncharacterized protein n=1 Tax=Caerostris extrusa TaxID=172846 RepID=A0AAV4N3T3_CAEEX|nr:hypothetical protein CEXT_555291 [Caerostris extrusa]
MDKFCLSNMDKFCLFGLLSFMDEFCLLYLSEKYGYEVLIKIYSLNDPVYAGKVLGVNIMLGFYGLGWPRVSKLTTSKAERAWGGILWRATEVGAECVSVSFCDPYSTSTTRVLKRSLAVAIQQIKKGSPRLQGAQQAARPHTRLKPTSDRSSSRCSLNPCMLKDARSSSSGGHTSTEG